jgi:hypothetical protein
LRDELRGFIARKHAEADLQGRKVVEEEDGGEERDKQPFFPFDDIQNLPILNGVIMEALRLHPAAPGGFPRVTTEEEMVIDGVVLKKGVCVFCFLSLSPYFPRYIFSDTQRPRTKKRKNKNTKPTNLLTITNKKDPRLHGFLHHATRPVRLCQPKHLSSLTMDH